MCGKINVLMAVLLLAVAKSVHSLQWDNSVDMDEEFRLLWNIKGSEITFEVQVATLGYVGIGFSANGAMDNADMAIGWVDQGQAYFQVRVEAGPVYLIRWKSRRDNKLSPLEAIKWEFMGHLVSRPSYQLRCRRTNWTE